MSGVKATTGNMPRNRTVSSPMSDDIYKPEWVPVRPGSQDHEKIPSRYGNRFEYRDGRVVEA